MKKCRILQYNNGSYFLVAEISKDELDKMSWGQVAEFFDDIKAEFGEQYIYIITPAQKMYALYRSDRM